MFIEQQPFFHKSDVFLIPFIGKNKAQIMKVNHV